MFQKIYTNSPVFIQNAIISMYGYYWKNRRFGGCFNKKLDDFNGRVNYTKNEWDNFQLKELRRLLIHAFTSVPFYEELYTKHGFSIKDFELFKIEDLKKLPYLEKDDLRKFGTSTLLSNKRKRGNFYNSSGSTGTPTKIFFSKEFHQTWSALYESRVRTWAGVNYKMPRAMIGGRRIILDPLSKPPFHRYNMAENQAYFSAYHISERAVDDYLEGLIKSKSKYLVGYAMSIHILSNMIVKKNLKAPKLKAVLTSSEKLTDTMRRNIENVFNCKVFDAYSGVEACGLISENSYGELLFSPDSGIMEVLDDKGMPVENGMSGEVIATGFLNYDQPLIRYRIGDCVKLSRNQNSISGIEMPIIEEIEGRIEDVVIGSDGQEMVRFHGVFIGIDSIIMAQLIQKSLKLIIIKLVVENSYSTENELEMVKRIKSQLGDVEIRFKYVDKIEKDKNGKYKAVISKL